MKKYIIALLFVQGALMSMDSNDKVEPKSSFKKVDASSAAVSAAAAHNSICKDFDDKDRFNSSNSVASGSAKLQLEKLRDWSSQVEIQRRNASQRGTNIVSRVYLHTDVQLNEAVQMRNLTEVQKILASQEKWDSQTIDEALELLDKPSLQFISIAFACSDRCYKEIRTELEKIKK